MLVNPVITRPGLFFLMKKKKGGNKTAVQFEPEYDDDTEITEESEDDMRFYDNQDDEE
mgnify:CR=1 FL=1